MLSRDFDVAGKDVRLQLNVNNVFDKEYFDNLYVYAPGAYSFVSYGAPREVVATLKVKF